MSSGGRSSATTIGLVLSLFVAIVRVVYGLSGAPMGVTQPTGILDARAPTT